MDYIVYSEHHIDGKIERWYYGTYSSREEANEVAYQLDGYWPVYYCICPASEAKDYNILNY